MEIKGKYSILYPDFEGVEYKQLSQTTCHDLSLDRLCKKLTDNAKESKFIMNTISNMTADPRVAQYRQKVFCDILKFPDLRKQIMELFDKFEFIYDCSKQHKFSNEKMGIWHLFRRMEELNDYITCVEAMQECLTENPVESEGLKGFREYVGELYRDANFKEMKEDIAALKIHSSEVKSVTVGINVNERFEATELGLISVNNERFKKSGIVSNFADALSSKQKIQDGAEWNGTMHYHPVDAPSDGEGLIGDFLNTRSKVQLMKMKSLSGKALSSETTASIPEGDGMVNFTFYLSNVVNKMLDMLLRKLRDTLDKYTDVVVVNISQLIPEFVYYIRFAEFVEKSMEQGYAFCEANVIDSDDKQMEVKDFYNLKLVVSGTKMEDIVTNHLCFDKGHTIYILTGANRGGKTTVTQAIGILYVLAQGGIFVPASLFHYKPLDCVYTHFQADEDKTLDLGRLGEECIRFKETYNACTKDSLCLLNESFSTTSFEEGYYIAKDSVRALLKKSVKTIYNTHMHKLGNNIDELNRENDHAHASSLVVQSEGGKRSFKIEVAPPPWNVLCKRYCRKVRGYLRNADNRRSSMTEKGEMRMFQIRPAIPEDYYSIKECLEKHGKELELTPQTGIMTAIENGFAGLGIYRLDEKQGEILEVITVNEQDWELGFFIGKAILNKVDLQGAKEVFCYNNEISDLLKKLEFLEKETGKWHLNLEGYFTSPCQRKKV